MSDPQPLYDLVDTLKTLASEPHRYPAATTKRLMWDAAAEIERLTEALRPFASWWNGGDLAELELTEDHWRVAWEAINHDR